MHPNQLIQNKNYVLAGIKALIALAETDLSLVRQRMSAIKHELTDAESDLIEVSLRLERLNTQLRERKARQVVVIEDDRSREIEHFRLRFPELCTPEEEE